MKRKIVRPLFAAVGLFFALSSSVSAAVETATVTTLNPSGKPVDTSVSADGRWLFVLTGKGTVDIFETNGTLKDTIKIEGQADTIASSPNGDRLFLSSKGEGTISVIAVDFVQHIETAGAPFKGAENAPVVVAVFTDFQCPYCAKISPLMDQVLALYPKDVKVAHKNFPLQSHQFAIPAAIAAFAAN
ncbi:MAG: thioredoxin domain-containing protein, partial [Desulfobulbaceae bacterium]|nr:thioredoxin domain-containing protein [Desulfobulbaceae bacterium]